ncbi:MAG: hypothetical protein AB8G05_00520 [Oligoflexales bacterium]
MDIQISNKNLNKIIWKNLAFGIVLLINPLQGQAGVENLGETIVNWKTKKLAQPLVYTIPTESLYKKEQNKEGINNTNLIYSIGIGTSERSRIIAEQEGEMIKAVLSRGRSKKAFKNILRQRFLEMFTWFPKKAVEKRHKKLIDAINGLGASVHESVTFKNYLKYTKIDMPVMKGLKADKISLDWEYRPNVTLDKVLHDIKIGGIENIIFIVHGDENGYIYDVEGNRFDETFFNLIGPELRSIAFYSCHGDKLVSAYKLLNIEPKSMIADRMVFTVPPSEKFNGDALSLSSGIKYFIRAVDSELFLSKTAEVKFEDHSGVENKSAYIDPAICSLDISGFDSMKSIFTARLNRQIVGAFRGKNPRVNFDCGLLKENELNTIILSNPHKNQDLQGHIFLQNQDIKIEISKQNRPYHLDVTYKNFGKNSNKKIYRSSKIQFTIAN